MFKTIRNRVVLHLITLIAGVAASSTLLYRFIVGEQEGCSIYFWIALGAVCYAVIELFRCYTLHLDKIRVLFEAIENNDFTFRFSSRSSDKRERITNDTLNRVKEMLSQAKQEAYLQEQYFELILSKSATGVVVCDDRGHIYQSNEAASVLLSQPHLTHLAQLEEIGIKQWSALITAPEGETKQVMIVDGERPVTLSVKHTAFTKLEKRLHILALNDISAELEEKELESWIQLSHVLTHEIMNNITPIRSLSELLLHSTHAKSEELASGLELIHTTSGNLMNFVTHYRQFAKVPPPVKEEIEVIELLTQCRRLMLPEISPSINLYIDVEEEVDVPLLWADRGQLVQVIVNLMRNASEAIALQESGRITLSARFHKKKSWVIGVENNGPAIPKEIIDHLFIPFFTTKSSGSGIGLSISKQIVRNHGGKLQLIHSVKGSTLFRILF